jgi:inhibitor of growth protein 3
MSRSRASTSNNETQIYNAYSLSLLSEYTHTLDSLPLDLSRNFADLRELDAVLSSQMSSITAKIRKLTLMIEEGTSSKDDRLLLLQDIANEANNLKMGGDDKIRVACQAADNLKMHTGHMKSLLRHLPSFDMSVLNRQTTYPHVASRSFQPPATAESGRRRRGVGSLLSIAPDPSPVKRKRVVREEEFEIVNGKTPRKEKAADVSAHKPRHGGRKKYVYSAVLRYNLLT